MINWSRAMLAPVAVAAAIGLAACGSGSAPASGSAQPSPDMSNMEGHDMSNMEGAQGGHGGHGGSGELELWAVQTGPLGTVVTDGSGAGDLPLGPGRQRPVRRAAAPRTAPRCGSR